MDDLDVRIANEGDFDGIARVIENHSTGPNKYYCPPPPDVAQDDRRVTFVAEYKNEIVAYLWMHCDKPFLVEHNDADFGLVVDPDCRHRGIGEKLLRSAIQYAVTSTRLRGVIAKIKRGNRPSESLCRRIGFKLEGVDTLGSIWRFNLER